MNKFDKDELQQLWHNVFDAVADKMGISVEISNHGQSSLSAMEFTARFTTNGWHGMDLMELYNDSSTKPDIKSDYKHFGDFTVEYHTLQHLCRTVMEPAMEALEHGKAFNVHQATENAYQTYLLENGISQDNDGIGKLEH
tara:strand:+ start:88 stop:507 length:420 start_codon:yes stop_codon:yes gene_type:complete